MKAFYFMRHTKLPRGPPHVAHMPWVGKPCTKIYIQSSYCFESSQIVVSLYSSIGKSEENDLSLDETVHLAYKKI